MNVTTAETEAIVAICALVVGVCPALTIAIIAWLRTKTNERAILTLPTHNDIKTAIDDKAKELNLNGSDTPAP